MWSISIATINQDKIHLNVLDFYPCAYIYNCAKAKHVRLKNIAVFAYEVAVITINSREKIEHFKKIDVM